MQGSFAPASNVIRIIFLLCYFCPYYQKHTANTPLEQKPSDTRIT